MQQAEIAAREPSTSCKKKEKKNLYNESHRTGCPESLETIFGDIKTCLEKDLSNLI